MIFYALADYDMNVRYGIQLYHTRSMVYGLYERLSFVVGALYQLLCACTMYVRAHQYSKNIARVK